MPFVFIATLSASFSVQARGAEPGLGPEDQLAAVERGRSKQRIVLAAQNRQILGMVVLQPRLLRDLMAYSSQLPANVAAAQKIVKQLDGLARFLTSGERSAFPDSLAYDWGYDWGYVTEPESSPISAHERWLTDLGIAEGEILGGDFIIVASGISLNVMYVVDHRDEAGDLATVLPPNPPPMPKKLSAAEVDQLGAPSPAPQIAHAQATDTSAWGPDPLRAYDVALAKRIEERYPTPAYPSISFGSGPLADARLGVALNTLLQLSSRPSLFAEPDMRRFSEEVLAEAARDSDASELQRIADFRAELARVAPLDLDKISFDAKPLADIAVMESRKRSKAVLFGVAVDQMAYTALSSRDKDTEREMRSFIARFDGLDAIAPETKEFRTSYASTAPDDWAKMYRLTRQATLDLIATGSSTP